MPKKAEEENQEQEFTQEALESLKAKARFLGISTKGLSVDEIRKAIAELDEPKQKKSRNKLKYETRKQIRDRAMRLVRIRVANLNTAKKNLDGEYVFVANEYIGTVGKYVPFGEKTENGWHVPYCIYEHLRDREFLHIWKVKDKSTGRDVTKTRWAKEFAIDVLPPLTEEEIKQIAAAQLAASD